MVADIFAMPVKRSLMKEQAGIGAAVLAGVGIGIYASPKEGAARFVKLETGFFYPDERKSRAYEDIYRDGFTRFRTILKPAFQVQ